MLVKGAPAVMTLTTFTRNTRAAASEGSIIVFTSASFFISTMDVDYLYCLLCNKCTIYYEMKMKMKICLLPQIFTVSAKQIQDINTSEKASNSNLPLIISMVKGAWSRSLWAPISVIRKKTFHFEGAENRKKRCIVGEEWHRFIYIREWSI